MHYLSVLAVYIFHVLCFLTGLCCERVSEGATSWLAFQSEGRPPALHRLVQSFLQKAVLMKSIFAPTSATS